MVLNFVTLHSYLVLYCGIFRRNPDYDDPSFDIIDCILKAQEEEESSLENCRL